MKVYITKYALSTGIYLDNLEQSTNFPNIVTRGLQAFHGEGRDWHRTEAAAIARADEMRREKIAALKRQIAKLEAAAFKSKN